MTRHTVVVDNGVCTPKVKATHTLSIISDNELTTIIIVDERVKSGSGLDASLLQIVQTKKK